MKGLLKNGPPQNNLRAAGGRRFWRDAETSAAALVRLIDNPAVLGEERGFL